VNVDAAAAGVLVLRLGPIEPDEAGDNGIAAGGVYREDFACGGAVANDGARAEVGADLVADAEIAERGLVAAIIIASAEARGGDGIAREQLSIVDDGEALLGDADEDLARRRRGRGDWGGDGGGLSRRGAGRDGLAGQCQPRGPQQNEQTMRNYCHGRCI